MEACGHVGFGEVNVLGKEFEELLDAFIVDVGVLGGEVDVSGVHQEAELLAFVFEG